MEDIVTTHGRAVPFSGITGAMASALDASSTRGLVATVVAVGPMERLESAAATLEKLGDAGTVRGILISEGDDAAPQPLVSGNTVRLNGLKPSYTDNAVAALRLSSLPTLVWWRGGRLEMLDGLADLADRIVLDEDEPEPAWRRATGLFEESAFTDVRWARLTQWRALMAQFFDIPEVQAASANFSRLRIVARDQLSARLFSAWLTSSLRTRQGFAVDLETGALDSPIEEVRLGDGVQELALRLAPGRTCLETAVAVTGHRRVSRVVSMHREDISDVLTGELRIRSRDEPFERTLRALIGTQAEALPIG
jgi:glucose-6-phosphate dehydrogenase assembly protein OpcA